MSYCREEGKDRLIFVTEEDHSTPSIVELPEDEEDEYEGLIKSSGEINWDCPCLQGMADGPCGGEFKAAFSCFHYSEEEPKGSDCIPQFRDMQICFSKFPEIYGKDDEDETTQGKVSEQINDSEAGMVLSSDEESEPSVGGSNEMSKANGSWTNASVSTQSETVGTHTNVQVSTTS